MILIIQKIIYKIPKNTSEAYSELNQTSKTEIFCENSQPIKTVNWFCKKAPPQTFDQTEYASALLKPLPMNFAKKKPN